MGKTVCELGLLSKTSENKRKSSSRNEGQSKKTKSTTSSQKEIKLESDDFIVEKILDMRLDRKGRKTYFVKWEGYDDDKNTWEPAKNFDSCLWKIQEYENSLKSNTNSSSLPTTSNSLGTSHKMSEADNNYSDDSDIEVVYAKGFLNDNIPKNSTNKNLSSKVLSTTTTIRTTTTTTTSNTIEKTHHEIFVIDESSSDDSGLEILYDTSLDENIPKISTDRNLLPKASSTATTTSSNTLEKTNHEISEMAYNPDRSDVENHEVDTVLDENIPKISTDRNLLYKVPSCTTITTASSNTNEEANHKMTKIEYNSDDSDTENYEPDSFWNDDIPLELCVLPSVPKGKELAKILAVVPIDGVLTFLVQWKEMEEGVTGSSPSPMTIKNVNMVRATAMNVNFPDKVIEFYENKASFKNDKTTKEEEKRKAEEAIKQAKERLATLNNTLPEENVSLDNEEDPAEIAIEREKRKRDRFNVHESDLSSTDSDDDLITSSSDEEKEESNDDKKKKVKPQTKKRCY